MSIQKIEQVVHKYFSALIDGDSKRILDAFSPTASIMGYGSDGSLVKYTAEEYADAAADNMPLIRVNNIYKGKIASIDMGEDTALVKTVCQGKHAQFSEVITLSRQENAWKMTARYLADIEGSTEDLFTK